VSRVRGTKAVSLGYCLIPGEYCVLADDPPPSEKAVRDSFKRLRKETALLRDSLKKSSDIATLDDAASHPERAVRGAATKIPR